MYSKEAVLAASKEYFRGDELAASTFLKYALRNKEGMYLELTPNEMHLRLSKEFARIESKYPEALSEQQIFDYLKDFKYIVPQGSPMMGIGNSFALVSLSNCIVVPSPQDSMSGIFHTANQLANLYKRRCGVGVDISTLRPDGSTVSNAAGSSSGAWSFADLYSYVTRMVGQNNRRGALMLTMDVRHPDIHKFVTMKHDKTKVTGANISVRLTDEFMNAVQEDKEFILKWPCESDTPKYTKVIRAKELWELITQSATDTAEPGLLMWDNIIRRSPADFYTAEGFRTICTNPCSELPLSAFDSCRLISVNLKWLVQKPFTAGARFDYEKFEEIIWAAQRLSDDLVDLEIEKLELLKEKTQDDTDEQEIYNALIKSATLGRRTGLGLHGLADTLSRLELPYDHEDAIGVTERIYKLLKETSYKSSVALAKQRGAFPIWRIEELDNEFLSELSSATKELIKQNGRRNIANLTNAPTGSVSILSQTSSGIEPVFRHAYTRRKKKTQDDLPDEKDFVDELGDRWTEYTVFHHNLTEYFEVKGTKEIPNYFVSSDKINYQSRVKIQAVMQKHIDHAISSTINLPKGTSSFIVGELYLESWKNGLKGVTVYVDESRTGVLVETKKDRFEYKTAFKRPDILECDIHQAKIQDNHWTILVGKIDDKPYEIFGGMAEDLIEISRNVTKGELIKRKDKYGKSIYDLAVPQSAIKFKNIVKIFDNPLYQVHTRMISLALRHGTQPSFLVEQLQKDPDNNLSSFSKVVARVLKTYVQNGTKVSTDKTCPSCSTEGLVYQDGCPTCSQCGWTKCG